VYKKGVIAPAIGTNLRERDLIKFDERDGRGRAVKKEMMGIGWKDALKEINLNLQSDLMEGILKRNSGRGMGMTFCQRRKGTRRAGTGAGSVIGGKGRVDREI